MLGCCLLTPVGRVFRPMCRGVVRVIVTVVAVFAAGCGGSSTAPTPPPASRLIVATPAAAGFSTPALPSAEIGRCFAGSNSPVCFTAAGGFRTVVVAGAVAPSAPGNLTATSSGSSVTLTWSAPLTGDPVQSYTIEAGTASALANLANFSTGSTATTFSTTGVPNGTYFVRVRGSNRGASVHLRTRRCSSSVRADARPHRAPRGISSAQPPRAARSCSRGPQRQVRPRPM